MHQAEWANIQKRLGELKLLPGLDQVELVTSEKHRQ